MDRSTFTIPGSVRPLNIDASIPLSAAARSTLIPEDPDPRWRMAAMSLLKPDHSSPEFIEGWAKRPSDDPEPEIRDDAVKLRHASTPQG